MAVAVVEAAAVAVDFRCGLAEMLKVVSVEMRG